MRNKSNSGRGLDLTEKHLLMEDLGLSEAHSIVVTIEDTVVELHEDIAYNKEILLP